MGFEAGDGRPFFVNGEWTRGSGSTFESINPADGSVAAAAYGIFASGGQSCIAGSRIFVHDAAYDRFVPRLVALAKRLRIGPPTDPATEVAPMASFPHRQQVQQQVQSEKGIEGMRAYMAQKSIYLGLNERPIAWP